MKFKVKVVSGKGCRLGMLSDLKSNPKLTYETPFSLTITKGGSIPHLTQDVYHNSFSKNTALCTPVQHFAGQLDVLQLFRKGVASFAALPTHPFCLVVQDPTENTPSGYNENAFVSVWNYVGRIKLTPQKYMKLVETIRPDWYEILNDADTPIGASRKRVEKSLRNSTKFLQQCLELHQPVKELEDVAIFAPLLGGHNACDRNEWISLIPLDSVDGFSLLGLHQNGSTATKLKSNQLQDSVRTSLEKLPTDKVKQAPGAFSVLSVLELVECGVDIFDSSLAYLATENGRAFCFPQSSDSFLIEKPATTTISKLGSEKPGDTQSQVSEKVDEIQGEDTNTKKMRVQCAKEARSVSYSLAHSPNTDRKDLDKPNPKEVNYFEIDLKDERFASAKEALLKGCQCYTCTTFTKSYIHHLLTVREMLADALLMIHNLHQWDRFFATIRKAVELDRFEQLKEFFTHYRNEDFEES